jgi:DNA polymerase-3 subunit alpha
MDARMKGIAVLPPDINASSEFIEIKDDKTLYAPFQAIKGISESSAKTIVDLRKDLGRPFTGKADFEAQLTARKIGAKCNATAREKLEKVGAFHSTDGGLAPLHPDRLKDRLEFMPGFTVDAVKADRKLTTERIAVLEIAKISGEARTCEKCSLKGKAHPLPAMGKSPKFMAVFDCPSWQDEKAGQMLSGDVGNVLKIAVKGAGMTPNDGYYTSLVKSPKDGKMLTNEQIIGCGDYLKREIATLKPPVILALGSNAIRFFAPGVKGKPEDIVGKVVYDPNIDASIVFGLNPAQVLFDPSKVKLLESACQKVSELIA